MAYNHQKRTVSKCPVADWGGCDCNERCGPFANNFELEHIEAAHPSRLRFHTSCARSPSLDGNSAGLMGSGKLASPTDVGEVPKEEARVMCIGTST